MSIPGWGGIDWSGGGGGGGAGTLTVTNITPASGSNINPTDTIGFDVTTGAGSMQVFVSATYGGEVVSEVVFDGSGLTALYRDTVSSVSLISGGLRFVVRRVGNWVDPTTQFKVNAADSAGDLLSTLLNWSVNIPVEVSPEAASSTAQNFDPLGFGVIRPFRRVSNNDFQTASGADLIRASIGQILGTTPGEIPWRPKFGCNLAKLRHMRNTLALSEIARISIQEAIQRWEPRVSISELTADPITVGNENKILLSLSYQIANSNPSTVKLLV